jgi:hypothetical protein
MDRVLARRLEKDEDFQKKVTKLVKDYVNLGLDTLNYYIDEFDAAWDVLMCYAPMTKADLENLERNHPRRFILPMTTVQISTMTTFIAQSLFGESTPHKVEGRGPEDEVPAEHLNQLLRWNAEQQPTYLLGYLWIQDVLTFNRGIFYNSWAPIYKSKVSEVEVEDPEELDEETGLPTTYLRTQRTQEPAGGFVKLHLVSPYDFFCDPALPLWRMQDGRFAGHRTIISWQELRRRSELPVDHPQYVLPSAVAALCTKGSKKKSVSNPIGKPPSGSYSRPLSRTAFERNRSTAPNVQLTANADDPGMIECYETWIRLVPADNDLYDGQDEVVFQTLLGNGDVVLSVGESTHEHGQFPYSVAEGRPNAYYQFSPSVVIMLKSLQDYVDYLKNRHQEALMRTVGNIFIARADKVNLADFLNPEKEGLVIPVLPEANGDKLDDIIRQVPINDVTKDFRQEIESFVTFSETVSGASQAMQGNSDGKGTATEFAGTQQMAAGRLTALARLISVEGLVPQCKQVVACFQQFLDMPMAMRFVPSLQMPAQFAGISALTITRDIIQGDFDFIAHDGTLPGTDSKKVAAMTRALEGADGFPQFFTPQPGNLDARAMILALLKASGVQTENFQFTAQSLAAMGPQPGPGGPPPGPGGPPGGGQLPNLLAALNPGPGQPPKPSATELPSASPPQIRPQNA